MYHRVILLVLLAAPLANSLISLSDVGDVISFTHEVVIDVLQAWKLVSPLLEGEGPEHIDLPIIKNKEKKLLSKIAQVNRRVENVDKAIQSATSASLLNFKQDFPSQIRLELRIDTLLEFVSMINFADHKFKEYTNDDYVNNTTETDSESRPNFERHTLESFATYVVSHTPSSVQGVMDRLHSMIYPDSDQGRTFLHTGVLKLLRNVLQGNQFIQQVQQRKSQDYLHNRQKLRKYRETLKRL